MSRKNKYNKGYTLAEMLVTLAVMGIVLALVTAFAAATSGATKARSQQTAVLREINNVNELISDWFYAFDDTDYTVLSVENNEPEYVFDYVEDEAIRVGSSEFTVQNKKFHEMIEGGIVPMNYQLVYNVDKHTYKTAITAVYSANASENKSITLNYITDIEFEYEESLGVFKCTYTYNDVEDEDTELTYTMVLSRHAD